MLLCVSGFQVDLFQLQVNTLRRYKRHYKLQTRPGLNKAQLAEVDSHHSVGHNVTVKARQYRKVCLKCSSKFQESVSISKFGLANFSQQANFTDAEILMVKLTLKTLVTKKKRATSFLDVEFYLINFR